MVVMNILIKPASSTCNLRCEYCFYHNEAKIRATRSFGIMNEETAEALVRKVLVSADKECTFGFQGGEPMLAGLGFFKKFMELQKRYNTKGIKINNTLQTNGTNIDEKWASFFADNDFLIGLSVDGKERLHDLYRKDTACQGTHKRVLEAARTLSKYNVDFNILSVVTAQAAKQAKSTYAFFMKNGFIYQQYIACLDPMEQVQGQAKYSLTPKLYARFLKDMFDVWYEDRKQGTFVYNRYFENLAGILRGYQPESCDMVGICSVQYAIEADGGVYPCDFYMLDEYLIGNINEDSFKTMENNCNSIGFVEESTNVPVKCKQCRWYVLCRNGCKRNRLNAELNYFCEAYLEFFPYVYTRLKSLVK